MQRPIIGARKVDPQSTEGSPEPLADINLRHLRAFLHYCDPASPAFGNKTKAVELAGYAGKPGSNQLCVQGSRVFARPKKHAGLGKLLMDTDCTLQRAFGCVSEAMSADIVRVVVADGKAMRVNCGPNHPVRLQGAKMAIELHSSILASEKDATKVEECDEISVEDNPSSELESDWHASTADGSTPTPALKQEIAKLKPAEYDQVHKLANMLSELIDVDAHIKAQEVKTETPPDDQS
jgi:hypothetical protein